MESERDRRKLKAREAAEKAQAASSLAKALNKALAKDSSDRTSAERSLIRDHAELAESIEGKIELRKQKREQAEARSAEVEDSPEELEAKIQMLCHLIKEAAGAKTPAAATSSTKASSENGSFSSRCDTLMSRGAAFSSAGSPGCRLRISAKAGDEEEDDVAADGDLLDPTRSGNFGRGGGGVVVHTGAGLSTTAGIPDFRGPNGVWTLQSKGQQTDHCMGLSYERVTATTGHMVLAAMHHHGLVSHVVTQNVDGLHHRSGIPKSGVSELHGCVFREQCKSCKKKYLRPFDVTVPQGSAYRRHKTGRVCGQLTVESLVDEKPDAPIHMATSTKSEPGATLQTDCASSKGTGADVEGCGGILADTIVHFGEMLDPEELAVATSHSSRADLALCLGSSFKVPPANRLPRLARQLVVVNLQWTPLDKYAVLKIHGRLDQVLTRVASVLGVAWDSYSPSVDPLLGKKFLQLQSSSADLPKSTLFVRKKNAAVKDEEGSSLEKKQKKRRNAVFGNGKRPKRVSFPRSVGV